MIVIVRTLAKQVMAVVVLHVNMEKEKICLKKFGKRSKVG
jgi:hypothetical protein